MYRIDYILYRDGGRGRWTVLHHSVLSPTTTAGNTRISLSDHAWLETELRYK